MLYILVVGVAVEKEIWLSVSFIIVAQNKHSKNMTNHLLSKMTLKAFKANNIVVATFCRQGLQGKSKCGQIECFLVKKTMHKKAFL